ncbi:unnamed protein product [Rotaria magnacalcarata]|uniref:Uncharacterized protein n=1 Tax=Rotaria magnacalcarata TaxID=392030 RepID=A0A8S2RCV0_9BILA|nr:unnamed protein product [Rotaria magnacalcarata]CAF4188638.1 unnamed protein product [Rotaria magnacalcarata]
MISWDAIGIGMAFLKNGHGLMIIQSLLGAAVSGFYSGMIVHFSLWYHKREQIMRVAIFHAATAASGAIGNIQVYAISKMKGIANLQDWQWIFLLEYISIIPLAIVTDFFLSNIPDTVRYKNSKLKNNVGGHTKRTIVVGFVSAMGQLGGIMLPHLYREVGKPTTYRVGHSIAVDLLCIALSFTFILRFSLIKENNRQDHLIDDGYKRKATVVEACDRHSDIRYVL